MDVAYFKERFMNTESSHLLDRRANSPNLNPNALTAIEEIILERGESLPVIAAKPNDEDMEPSETKSDKFWRIALTLCVGFAFTAIIKNFATGFLQLWGGTLVWLTLFIISVLTWLHKKRSK